MNDNNLSTKLDRIDSATTRIRTKLAMEGSVIEDVATRVEQLDLKEYKLGTKNVTANGTFAATDDNLDGFSSVVVNVPSGGTPVKSNVYRVPTMEARDAITDMVEGDICVVYESNISNVTVDSRFQTAIFPEVVVLDTAITDYVDVRYRAVDESIMFDCFGMIDSSMFDMGCYSESGEINIRYTSTDGITYTRTDTIGNPVDFGTEIKYDRPEMWNNAIGKFIQSSFINFGGLFQYKDNHWSYADIGISIANVCIYKDCKAYTNTGIVVGTLALKPAVSFDDMNAQVYSELSVLYNNFDEIIAPEDSSKLYDQSGRYLIPSRLNGESLLNTRNVTNMDSMFSNCYNLISIPHLDTSNVTNMRNMFMSCSKLITIPQIDTSNVTSMYGMFSNCVSLTSIPQLDTSKVTTMSGMFSNCYALTEIPQLNTSNVTNIGGMFRYCSKLTTIPQLDTGNVTNMGETFSSCASLTTIPQLDASKVTYLINIFIGCHSLTTLGGFTNLGQAYETSKKANYEYYTLDLNYVSNLTHDSLMNVINNLYDIASKGCNPQSIVLGSTNKAKLTAEEISIATRKGWIVA